MAKTILQSVLFQGKKQDILISGKKDLKMGKKKGILVKK